MQRKILIVDDNEINRQILSKMLCEEYELHFAGNGQEALKILGEFHESLSAVLLDIVMPVMNGYEVLERMQSDRNLLSIPVIVATGNTGEDAEVKALALGANDFIVKPYNPSVIRQRIWNTIRLRETAAIVNAAKWDKLTGLYNREAFFEKAAELVLTHEPGYYVMACFDINNFKVINDQYGTKKGDEVLRFIADVFQAGFEPVGGICCRVTADNFAVLYPYSFVGSQEIGEIRRRAAMLDGSILPITFSIGRYLVDDLSLSAASMYDRATLAEAAIRGRYDVHIAQYDESMRDRLLHEQKIVTEMNRALEEEQFEIWFQPQYNHVSGALIGAEALVRWRHPEEGLLIPPGEFIPVFERNGFIYEMDKYVWRQACMLLRKWLDQGRNPLPISVNVSRYDVFRDDFHEVITGYVEQYDIPIDLLRLEVTETAFAKSTEQIVAIVKRLIDYGFTVEIDDFGSGYSSLNTLKDVPATILKLDMRFLEDTKDSKRGGNILESVVRMAKWLGMSVIAEGVETRAQADFLTSIGCYLIQGYFYAKPMPVNEYEQLASRSVKEGRMVTLETVDMLDNNTFWSPNSMDTLIFNSYVGGACIFEYHAGKTELLRINDKYAKELGGEGMSVQEALALDLKRYMDESSLKTVQNNIERAIETGAEATCEARMLDLPGTQGDSYIRTTVRMIATVGDRHLFYCAIINMTAQRLAEQKELATSEQMRAIMDNVNGGVSAMTLDEHGRSHFIFANSQYFSMLGYTREQFEAEVGNAFDAICPEHRERVCGIVRGVMASGGSCTYEYSCMKRDGDWICLRCSASVTDIKGVKERVLLSVVSDVTQLNHAEQQILRSTEQLRFLNETAHDLLTQANADRGIEEVLHRVRDYFDGDRAYVIELDEVRQVSSNTYEVCATGVSSEKARLQSVPFGTNPFWFYAFEQNDYVNIEDVGTMESSRAKEQQLLQEQGVQALIAVPLRREGELMGFLGVDDPRRHQSHVDHLQAIGDYIAAMLCRRDLNAKIESDNKALIALMNDTPGGFARMRVFSCGKVVPVYVNDGMCKLVGMTREELMENYKESAMWGVHPDDIEIVGMAVEEMLSSGETRSAKYRLRHGDGGYVWVMIFGRMAKNESDEVFFNVYYTNLSEVEKKELSFRDMLPAALAAMMESSAELCFVKDKNLRYMCCSRAFAQMVGLESEKDILGKTDYDLFDKALADAYRADDCRLLEEGRPIIEYVEQIPSTDGSLRYSSTSKYLLFNSHGSVIGLYGTGWDITKARADSEQLVKERIYQKALDTSSPICTVIFSLTDGSLLHMGGTLMAELGYTREEYEAFHQRDLRGFVLEEDYGTVFKPLSPLAEQPALTVEQEFRARRKDGSLVWLYEKGTLTELHEERVYIVVFVNITRRKEMEERLRISEEEMRLAMEQMGQIVCLYDVKTQLLTMPEAYVKRHGFESNTIRLPERAQTSFVYLDEPSREAFIEFYEAILRGEKSGCGEIRIKNADGTWAWESGEFVTIFDGDGAPIKAIVTVEDTTQQHRKNDEVRACEESEQVFRIVAAHSSRLIYRYDLETKTAYTDVGNAIKKGALSIDKNVPESIISSGVVLPESVEDYRRIFKEIHEGKLTGGAKVHMNDAQGMPHWIDMQYTLIQPENEPPKTAVISFLDITEDHEKELAYDRYLQTIDQNAMAEGVLMFLEADLIADLTEKRGGSMLPADFPGIGTARMELVDHIAEKYVIPEERDRCKKFFAREHLFSVFSEGIRNLSEDWSIIFPDGSPGFARSELQLVQDPYSGHIKVYTILRDITQKKRAALEVKKKAEIDGMTEVYNKSTTEALIRKRLSRADGTACMLLVADLDNLKAINDTLGHVQGDRAIRMIGGELRAQFRQTDIVGRVGGDEFAAFLDNCGTEAWVHSAMLAFTKKLSTLRVGEAGQFPLRASIGIAFGTVGKDSYEELFKKADRALYHVKRNGKNDFAFYSPKMEEITYQYRAHGQEEFWNTSLFSREGLDLLLEAVSAIYPLVISVNLTRNSYYMMRDETYTTRSCVDTGVFDELIEEGFRTFCAQDRQAFVDAFSRESLLAAYARGERTVSHEGYQRGDDGLYRLIHTDVIFVKSTDSDDILEVTLARQVGGPDRSGQGCVGAQ